MCRYTRSILRPIDAASSAKLQALYGTKTLVPLDLLLGLDRLPFKMSTNLMLDLTYWSVKLFSYEQVASYFLRRRHLSLSDDTIRQAKNFVGNVVLNSAQKQIVSASQHLPDKGCEATSSPFYIYAADREIALRPEEGRQKDLCSATLCVFRGYDVLFLDQGTMVEKYACLGIIGNVDDFEQSLLWLFQEQEESCGSSPVVIFNGSQWVIDFCHKYLPKATLTLDVDYLKFFFRGLIPKIFEEDAEAEEFLAQLLAAIENNSWQTLLESVKLHHMETQDQSKKSLWAKLCEFLETNLSFLPKQKAQDSSCSLGSFVFSDPHNFFEDKFLTLPKGSWQLATAKAELLLRAKLASNLWDSAVVQVVRDYIANGLAK
ncbi:MAG: hypothetical protein IJT59_00850 [Desulfovibrionaceae bacterium]|nr:hypothetical protein [Desulfovibrionaceae bacterium]